MLWLARKFDLDQSERKSSQVNASQRTGKKSWSPGQTDRQVVASGHKLNSRRDLRWVAKRIRKFRRKYTQVEKKKFLIQTILYFIS